MGIGKIVFLYESDVLFYFLWLKVEEHLAGLEVAQLQYKMYFGVDVMQFLQHTLRHTAEGALSALAPVEYNSHNALYASQDATWIDASSA